MIETQKLIGTANQNLVLVTAGRLYVKVADRYYEIDFRNEKIKESKKEEVIEAPEIDLSNYITKEKLIQIIDSYNFETAIKNINAEIDKINRNINNSNSSYEEEEYDIEYDINPYQDLDQTTFTFIGDPFYWEEDLLYCPDTVIEHPYLLQRKNSSTEATAKWNVSGRETEDSDSEFEENVSAISNGKFFLYIVASKELDSNNYGTAYYLVSYSIKPFEDEDNYYFYCGIIYNNEWTDGIEFVKAYTSGVPKSNIYIKKSDFELYKFTTDLVIEELNNKILDLQSRMTQLENRFPQ